MLRVVHLGPGGGDPGGMASAISSLAEALRVHGRGLEVQVVDSFQRSARLHSVGPAARAAWHLLRHRWTVDIAHVHLSERGSFVREGFLLGLARLLGLATVATLHGADFPEFAARWPRTVRRVLRWCDAVIALGPEQRALVASWGLPSDLEVIPNVAPVIAPGQQQGDRDAGPVVLFAGEVGRRKGADRLLKAWPAVVAAVPGARLVVCGPQEPGFPGDDDPDAHDEGVRYLGSQPRSAVLEIMRDQARVLCLPSRSEVLPMVLLEAVAAGLRIVTTDVGEIRQLAGFEGVCVLVSPEDSISERDFPVTLAAALIEALECPLPPQVAASRVALLTETMGAGVVAAAHTSVYQALRRPSVRGLR